MSVDTGPPIAYRASRIPIEPDPMIARISSNRGSNIFISLGILYSIDLINTTLFLEIHVEKVWFSSAYEGLGV
jgi:hypothetical protein